MKQGAIIDFDNSTRPPWIMLLLNFMMNEADKDEMEGAFPLQNLGHGWIGNVHTQEEKSVSNGQKREITTSVITNNN